MRSVRCGVAGVLAAAATFAAAGGGAPETELRGAAEAAHREIWRRFISPHGTFYDYAGLDGRVLLPTAEECLAHQPNALGWWTPIENGGFFGGLYLDALTRRWAVTREPQAAEEARRVAAGLLKLAASNAVPGFVARGFAGDGAGHYAASSSDQTYPWFYGLWRYATSALPDGAERQAAAAAMARVARGLEANDWKMPCDRAGFGHFGHWSGGFAGTRGVLAGAEPQFDAAVRFLFVLRALHQVTGDARWLALYRERLAETPPGAARTRLQICAEGVQYVAPGEPPRYPESPPIWTSASTQAGLRALAEMETDPSVRNAFQRGLDANAASAARFIGAFRAYDNANALAFDVNWRALCAGWTPQAEIGEAVQLARKQYSAWNRQSPRRVAEADGMRDPLFAAWIVALSGNAALVAKAEPDIRGALTHYRWERLHTCLFFMAECVYWQLQAPAAATLTLWPSELCEAQALPDSRVTAGAGSALRVEAGKNYDWPGARVRFKSGACDLSAYDVLRVTLRNVGGTPAELFCCLKNRQPRDCFLSPGGSALLQPGERREIEVGLRLPPWVVDRPLGLVGMRGVPGPTAGSVFDLNETHELHLFLNSPCAPATFEVVGITAEVRESARVLLSADTFFPFVDRFGQFAHGEWPGKVHGEEELLRAREQERAGLAGAQGPGDRDRWGGWARGPQLRATGRFRTEKVSGKWWLVDPDGRLFFSHGVGCVVPGAETGVTGRERYFAWLPEPESAFGAFFVSGGRMPYRAEGAAAPYRTYDFAKANLLRKYGEGWEPEFAELAHRRLRAWGLNTVANWSDARVCQLRRTPYTATVPGAARTIANQCPDPFAPAFAEELRNNVQALRQSGAADDPWCVGCFVDNEIGWGADGSVLVRQALCLPADRPVKQAAAAWLQKKYATPAALNAVWGSSFESWEALLRNTEIPDGWACGADCEGFLAVLAERYFAAVRDALKAAAPDLLYLGCRFSWGPDAVYRVASAHCDVVSVNLYRRSVSKELPAGCADKPMIIGEFHFGAMDRGLFHTGLGQTRDQAERAACYAAYVRSGLAHPRCVGTHWFQWRDQALTGRGDGENYPVGFLTVTDQPCPELVAAAREVGETMYAERYGRPE